MFQRGAIKKAFSFRICSGVLAERIFSLQHPGKMPRRLKCRIEAANHLEQIFCVLLLYFLSADLYVASHFVNIVLMLR